MEGPGLQLQSPICVAGPASWKQHKDSQDRRRNSACKRPLARHHANAPSVMDPSGLEDVTRDALGSSPFQQPRVLQALRGVADQGGLAAPGRKDQRGRNLGRGPPPARRRPLWQLRPDPGEAMLCNKSAGGVGRRGLGGRESAGPRQEQRSSCIQTPAPGIAAEGESAQQRLLCVRA